MTGDNGRVKHKQAMRICQEKISHINMQKGVAIIESLIASAIFAIGLLGLSQYQGLVQQESALIKAKDAATVYAQAKIDEIRSMSEAQFSTEMTNCTTPDICQSTLTLVNANFTRNWQFSTFNIGESDRQLSVWVEWEKPNGTTEIVRLGTFLYSVNAKQQALHLSGGQKLADSTGAIVDPDKEYTQEEFDQLPFESVIGIGDALSLYTTDDGKTEVILQTLNEQGDTIYDVVLITLTPGVIFLRGTVTLEDRATTSGDYLTTDTTGSALTSEGGYCIYPEQDNYDIVGIDGVASPALDSNQARFHCLVGQTWYGNLGVTGFDRRDLVCPPVRSYAASIGLYSGKEEVGSFETTEGTSYPETETVWVVDGQDFSILPNRASCDVPTGNMIEITGSVIASHDASLAISGLSDLGSTTIEASTVSGENSLCSMASSPMHAGQIDFSCMVEMTSSGYPGRIVLIPDPDLRICGSNAIYFDENPVADSITDGFVLASDSDSCSSHYEHLITVPVVQSAGQGIGVADKITFEETSGNASYFSCGMANINSQLKDATYLCTTVAPLGASLTIRASFSDAVTNQLDYGWTDRENSVTTQADLATSISNDFELTMTDFTYEVVQ